MDIFFSLLNNELLKSICNFNFVLLKKEEKKTRIYWKINCRKRFSTLSNYINGIYEKKIVKKMCVFIVRFLSYVYEYDGLNVQVP